MGRAPLHFVPENRRSSSEGARAMTNCACGSLRGDLRDRIADDRQQPLDFVRPAARQQRHDRPLRIEPDLAQKTVLRLLRAREIDERMSDELHRHAGIAIDLFLERKDHEHAIDEPLHHLHAALAPRPELRADVIDDGHAELLDRRGETEIEVGKIDQDERVRLLGARGIDQPVEGGERFGEHANRLDEPRHAEAAIVREQLAAAGHQPLAAEPEDGGVGLPAANFDCEGAGV